MRAQLVCLEADLEAAEQQVALQLLQQLQHDFLAAFVPQVSAHSAGLPNARQLRIFGVNGECMVGWVGARCRRLA